MIISVYKKVLDQIIQHGKGKLVFPADFIGLGTNAAIRKAFSQLTREKILIRLGQGIYLFPERDKAIGVIYPSMETIAQAIAIHDRARIVPTGSQALYKLRLSTQVPMNLVYLADGVRRDVKLGRNKISFRSAPPRRLATKGKISTLAIQALHELGKQEVDQAIIRKIKKALEKEDMALLRHDATLAPTWISDILLTVHKELNHARMAQNGK